MWIIFEGLDKSGKGTLEREVLKATNYKHIIIDRGPVGYTAFDILFGRVTTERRNAFSRNVTDMKMTRNFIVVYCKVPANIAMERIKEHNESCPYDYKFAQEIYDEGIEILYKQNGIKVIEVDTTKSIEECVNLILNLGGLK